MCLKIKEQNLLIFEKPHFFFFFFIEQQLATHTRVMLALHETEVGKREFPSLESLFFSP